MVISSPCLTDIKNWLVQSKQLWYMTLAVICIIKEEYFDKYGRNFMGIDSVVAIDYGFVHCWSADMEHLGWSFSACEEYTTDKECLEEHGRKLSLDLLGNVLIRFGVFVELLYFEKGLCRVMGRLVYDFKVNWMLMFFGLSNLWWLGSRGKGDDHGSLFTNSNWFTFQDNIEDDAPNSATSAFAMLDGVNLNGTSHGSNSSSDNEVVVGEDEELVTCNGTSTFDPNPFTQKNKVENSDAT
ncbi:serine/threonine-protein phosphatase 6 regulatory subunit 3-like protein isoform X2 [Tanacetum coccineum]